MRHPKGTIVRAIKPLANARALEPLNPLTPLPQEAGVIGMVVDLIGHSFSRVQNEVEGWVANVRVEELERVGFIKVKGPKATFQIDGQPEWSTYIERVGAANVRAAAFLLYLVRCAADAEPAP